VKDSKAERPNKRLETKQTVKKRTGVENKEGGARRIECDFGMQQDSKKNLSATGGEKVGPSERGSSRFTRKKKKRVRKF